MCPIYLQRRRTARHSSHISKFITANCYALSARVSEAMTFYTIYSWVFMNLLMISTQTASERQQSLHIYSPALHKLSMNVCKNVSSMLSVYGNHFIQGYKPINLNRMYAHVYRAVSSIGRATDS